MKQKEKKERKYPTVELKLYSGWTWEIEAPSHTQAKGVLKKQQPESYAQGNFNHQEQKE